MIVRDENPRRLGVGVHDLDRGDPRGREGVGDHLGGVVAVIDDVDLLPTQLAHDVSHALSLRPDARSLAVDVRGIRANSDLAAMSRFPGDGRDLDGSVRDLGHLECEQRPHQVRVCSGQRDNRAFEAAPHTRHQCLDARTVLVGLPGGLFLRWKVRLDLPQIHPDHPRVGRLLNNPGNQVAFLTAELGHRRVALGLTQSRQQHLPSGRGRDAPEAFGGVVEFSDHLTLVVDLAGPHGHVAGLAVELDASVLGRAVRALVGHQQRRLDGLYHQVQREVLLPDQAFQCCDVDIHQVSFLRSNSTSTTALDTSS